MAGNRKPEGVSMRYCNTTTVTIPLPVHLVISKIKTKTGECNYEIIKRLAESELARLEGRS